MLKKTDNDTCYLLFRTKELLVSILSCLQEGSTLREALLVESEAQEHVFHQLLHKYQQKNLNNSAAFKSW
jgi:hypothetical protein